LMVMPSTVIVTAAKKGRVSDDPKFFTRATYPLQAIAGADVGAKPKEVQTVAEVQIKETEQTCPVPVLQVFDPPYPVSPLTEPTSDPSSQSDVVPAKQSTVSVRKEIALRNSTRGTEGLVDKVGKRIEKELVRPVHIQTRVMLAAVKRGRVSDDPPCVTRTLPPVTVKAEVKIEADQKETETTHSKEAEVTEPAQVCPVPDEPTLLHLLTQATVQAPVPALKLSDLPYVVSVPPAKPASKHVKEPTVPVWKRRVQRLRRKSEARRARESAARRALKKTRAEKKLKRRMELKNPMLPVTSSTESKNSAQVPSHKSIEIVLWLLGPMTMLGALFLLSRWRKQHVQKQIDEVATKLRKMQIDYKVWMPCT
jgi:hypothetical protein